MGYSIGRRQTTSYKYLHKVLLLIMESLSKELQIV